MAIKPGILHLLSLGLIFVLLILYSVYTYTPIEFNSSITYTERKNEEDSMTNTLSKLPIKPLSAVLSETLSNIINNSISIFSADEKSMPKILSVLVSEEKTNLGDGKNYANGVLTCDLYDPGHDIPNIQLCPKLGTSLKFLILITSAPKNAIARIAIRQTWGHYARRRDIAMSFVLGQTGTPELPSSIQLESDLYSDIIGCRFIDSYNNLTLKTICMMEWIDSYCPKVKFILKTDDDMFINIPKLISFVDQRREYKRTIFGRLAKGWRPFRDIPSKWFISTQQYTPNVFPDFTTGPAYLLTGDIVQDLYTNALNTTYFRLEDVFMTGVVAESIKVNRVNADEFLNKRIKFRKSKLEKYISIHNIEYPEQFDLWKILYDRRG